MNDSKKNVNDSTNAVLTATPLALAELKRIALEEDKDLQVRVACRGGGCSGMTIDISFTKFPPDPEFDIVIKQDDLLFFVDKKSALFIQGAILDFGGGLLDRGFHWEFPDAKSSCGCGTSFSF